MKKLLLLSLLLCACGRNPEIKPQAQTLQANEIFTVGTVWKQTGYGTKPDVFAPTFTENTWTFQNGNKVRIGYSNGFSETYPVDFNNAFEGRVYPARMLVVTTGEGNAAYQVVSNTEKQTVLYHVNGSEPRYYYRMQRQ